MKGNILLVDDNEAYRKAFKRNLELLGFKVFEAENKDSTIEVLSKIDVDVIITDLDMRYRTEGLELIKDVKNNYPVLPIILISAVGTFEDGASARELGAAKVISKSSIDKELESLYEFLKKVIIDKKKNKKILEKIHELSKEPLQEKDIEFLKILLKKDNTPDYIKISAFELLESVSTFQPEEIKSDFSNVFEKLSQETIKLIEGEIERILPDFKKFDEQTKEAFRTAEFLWQNQEKIKTGIDFSRSIGFAYSFSVENECKKRFRKNIESFLRNRNTYRYIDDLYDESLHTLDLWYQRYLLFLQQEYDFNITMNNIALVFKKIKNLKQKFKPDGLKALGICLLCFARNYSFKMGDRVYYVDKPLSIGMNKNVSDEMILKLAAELISLQHYRNPFIHPEISGNKKISQIRDMTIKCLKKLSQI